MRTWIKALFLNLKGHHLVRFLYAFLLFTSLQFAPSTTFAIYTHHDTGQILKVSQYKLGLGTQIITDPSYYEGSHFFGYLDSGLNDESNVRVSLGVGSKFFHTGAFYKWVPIPDYQNQPAVGIKGGVIYARHSKDEFSENNVELSLRAHPFVSKNFKTLYGDLNTYGALHLGLKGYNDVTTVPTQVSIGGELKTHYYDATLFTAEIGINMSQSFTYVSIGIVFFVDDNKDYKLENPLKK